ncbi:hypothetical protein QUF79_07300 [Fictibacillus enclensis]|uniref:hypothetical protein n=1 Tax=Fictibacillus enclensis TaxID=1017270 RepID=UPI0025A2174D|nr:hypothetical protein [Fictibacillus enclensis]MDM5197821.1 hypothetical protein [Fictibacillus enclensis]
MEENILITNSQRQVSAFNDSAPKKAPTADEPKSPLITKTKTSGGHDLETTAALPAGSLEKEHNSK